MLFESITKHIRLPDTEYLEIRVRKLAASIFVTKQQNRRTSATIVNFLARNARKALPSIAYHDAVRIYRVENQKYSTAGHGVFRNSCPEAGGKLLSHGFDLYTEGADNKHKTSHCGEIREVFRYVNT